MTYTPTQKRIIAVLSDGKRHERKEVLESLGDSQAGYNNLHYHIHKLRRVLEEGGQTIVCELYKRKIHYRQVRLLPES